MKGRCQIQVHYTAEAQNNTGNKMHWTDGNKTAKMQPMYGPKPTRLQLIPFEQSQMYHHISGNMIVWSAQSLARYLKVQNSNKTQKHKQHMCKQKNRCNKHELN